MSYWEDRYAAGVGSGDGSYGDRAVEKAKIVNDFVREHKIQSVIDFGCGDGNQLSLATYPVYHGLDISETAVATCRERFKNDRTKTFATGTKTDERAEMSLSIDVIFHLVDDQDYTEYMQALFAAATRFVVIYSTDIDTSEGCSGHVRHRKFTDLIPAGWRLVNHIPIDVAGNTLQEGFWFYEHPQGEGHQRLDG
jgi:SAM-dependent methyltransferase